MVIITEASYPWSSLFQAAEAMKKVTAPPSFVTVHGPYLTAEKGVGNSVLAVYEFSDDKFKEVVDYITGRMFNFVGVPGYTWEMKPYYKSEEAIKFAK
jgi:hypothetical protein